jgi:hypothetical protein
MRDDILGHGGHAEGHAKAGLPGTRRRVRMTRTPGQSLVLSSLGGCAGEGGPIEIRFAEVGAGGAATLDFLLPDHIFVEHKETMDSVHALFCARPPVRPRLKG